jgi:hypothetical protein
VNKGLQVAGAPQGVTDVTQTVADVVPANFIGQAATQGARGLYNTATGDTKAIDRQVDEMAQGKSGAPLQGYAMLAQIIPDVASGKGFESTMLKVGSQGQDTSVARMGNYLGDQTYQFVNKDLPEATEFAKKDLQRAEDAVKAEYAGAKQGANELVGKAEQKVDSVVEMAKEKYRNFSLW